MYCEESPASFLLEKLLSYLSGLIIFFCVLTNRWDSPSSLSFFDTQTREEERSLGVFSLDRVGRTYPGLLGHIP